MRYPEFLKNAGTIGFPAPSFGCSIEPYRTSFDHALKVFRKKGFHTLPGPNAYAGDGIGISTSPQKCGEEFTQMMLSDRCDVLISCGGGELMCEILEFVDFSAIARAKPKWFMGYSDNTNLTYLLNTLCDTASIYGPCASSFGMKPWHPSITDAWKLLRGKKFTSTGYDRYETESLKDEKHPLAPYSCTEPRKLLLWHPETGRITGAGESVGCAEARFSGRLIGGCLDILANLCGTRFDRTKEYAERYAADGFIWFLEACDLNVFSIRRAIWELSNAGWFSHVNGFLIGRPHAGQEELMGLDHIHAVTDLLASFRVPILLDADIGHMPPMMPLISGSMAHVTANAEAGTMSLSMELR